MKRVSEAEIELEQIWVGMGRCNVDVGLRIENNALRRGMGKRKRGCRPENKITVLKEEAVFRLYSIVHEE